MQASVPTITGCCSGRTGFDVVAPRPRRPDPHSHDGEVTVVLGVGIMGSAVARNLAAAGLPTTVLDRSLSATAPLSEAGARVAASPGEAVRGARLVITMLPTAAIVESVIFSGAAQAFAQGAVWAQMGTIGITGTSQITGRLGSSARTSSSSTRQYQAARPRPRPASCSSWPQDRPRRSPYRPSILRDRPQDGLARRSRPGQPNEACCQRLHVHADRGRSRSARARRLTGHRRRTSCRRPSKAVRSTHQSPTPSCTKWPAATLRPSSQLSGHSRTSTWRSRQQEPTLCLCSPRSPAGGVPQSTRATAGKTLVPRAWHWAVGTADGGICGSHREPSQAFPVEVHR